MVDEIDFYIGIDCPFCFNQCHNTLMGSHNFSYNQIYCTNCRVTDLQSELFDSKFEIWFLDKKLISVIISDNLGDKYFHSEYSPIQGEVNLFADFENKTQDIPLKKWNLKEHFSILYSYIETFDLSHLMQKPGFSFKIKQIIDNPNIFKEVKAKLFNI